MSDAAVLTLVGEVDHPLSLTVSELAALVDGELVADFHCHEGWTKPALHWRGVRLTTLLALAQTRETGRHVTLGCDGFTVVLAREQVEDERVLLALERDGKPISTDEGLPRLVGPADWDCFLSVKSVDRIELTREPAQATSAAIALARIGR